MKKKSLKIAFGTALPVLLEDKKTITSYLFYIRVGGNKRRMCFDYDCRTQTIVSYTPSERNLSVEQLEKILQYFKCFVGKRKAKEFSHIESNND